MVARRAENRFHLLKSRDFCYCVFLKLRIHHHEGSSFKVKHCICFNRQLVQSRFEQTRQERSKIQLRSRGSFIRAPVERIDPDGSGGYDKGIPALVSRTFRISGYNDSQVICRLSSFYMRIIFQILPRQGVSYAVSRYHPFIVVRVLLHIIRKNDIAQI